MTFIGKNALLYVTGYIRLGLILKMTKGRAVMRISHLKSLLVLFVFLLLIITITVDLLNVRDVDASMMELPPPLSLLALSEDFEGPLLKGIVVDQNNLFDLTFIVDCKDNAEISKQETRKLINYFMTGLAFSKEDLWVNLSPYEEDRVIDDELSRTELGIDLVAQDYVLKLLSSSLTHPDTSLGKAYWGMNNRKSIIENTNVLGKIWISPDSAEVLEYSNGALVTLSQLKVESQSRVVNELICPSVKKDVNSGKNFSTLRQLYCSLILAQWFKQKFFQSYYKNYIHSNNVKGFEISGTRKKENIYQMYLESFKKGSYNIIQKNKFQNREYFSGGWKMSDFAVKVNKAKVKDIYNSKLISSTSVKFVQTSLRLWRGDTLEEVVNTKKKIDNLIAMRSSSGLLTALATDIRLLKRMTDYRKKIKDWLDEDGIYQERFRSFLGSSWNIVEEMISGTKVTKLMYIQIDALSCNSFCVWCSASGASRGDKGEKLRKKVLDKEALLKLMREVYEEGHRPLIRYAGWVGEPLADLATLDLIKKGGEFGFKQVLITNGRHLGKELWPVLAKHLDYVSVSLDAPSDEINQRIKLGEPQGVWTKKVENIEGLIKYAKQTKSDMKLKVSYILHPENYKHLSSFAQRLKAIGVEEFIPKVTHSEPAAKLNPAQLKKVYDDIRLIKRKSNKSEFKVSPFQDYDEAEKKMNQYDLPDFRLCYAARWQHVVGGEKFFSCCHYNMGTIGSSGNVGEHSFGNVWRSKKRVANLNKDPSKSCPSCPPTDLHLNRALNGIAQAYGFDEMILDYIKAKIDGRKRETKSLSPFKMVIGRIDPYTGGLLLKLLYALKIYNMRDVIRALHFQQRNIGVVDVDQILKADVHQSAGEYDIVYNPLKDHSVKQEGNPPYMDVPDNLKGLISKFGLKSLYLIPAFVAWKFRARRKTVFDNLPYTTRYFKWKSWKIFPDMYSWAMQDTCTILSDAPAEQDGITENDVKDMNELIRQIGYGSITYGSLGAGSKIDHKNFRFAGVIPKESVYEDQRIIKYSSDFGGDLSGRVKKLNDQLKKHGYKSNILFTVNGKKNQVLVIGRTQENSKLLNQPHGAWEVLLNKIVLTKKDSLKKVDQRLVSPAEASKIIDSAMGEVIVSQKIIKELALSIEKKDELSIEQNGGVEFKDLLLRNTIDPNIIETQASDRPYDKEFSGLTYDITGTVASGT